MILCCTLTVDAQTLSNRQKRQMNIDLLDLLDRYDDYSTFSESYMQYGFVSLFKAENTPVFCDYIASPDYGKNIPASRYAEYSAKQLNTLYPPTAKNVHKGEYYFVDGRWHINLMLERSVSYIDQLGVFFNGDYELVLDCEYDQSEEMFKIASVKGKNVSKYLYPSGRFNIVNRTSPFDTAVEIFGKGLSFNEFNQAITPDGTFVFNDDDMVMTQKELGRTERYSLLEFKYSPKKSRLRVNFGIAPLSAYNVSSMIDFSTVKSSASELTVDYGYMWKVAKSTKLGLNIGLGVSMSKLFLEKNNTQYSINLSEASVNPDKFLEYTRTYNLKNVSEGLSFQDIVVPFYLSFEQKLAKRIGLTVDAGAKLYLNAKTTVTPYSVEGTVTNSYLGQSSPQKTESLSLGDGFLIPSSYKRNVYDLSVFARAGFDIQLYKMLFMTMKVGYEMGMLDSYKSQMTQWFSPGTGDYPVYYSAGKDVKIKSFIDCISYKRNALVFEFGVKVKL